MVLAKPGILGRSIRLALAAALAWLGYATARDARFFFDGIDVADAWPLLLALVVLSSWVVNELLQRPWGQRPLLVLLAGAGVAAGVAASQGDVFGPPLGIYVWVWTMLFVFLLGPAHLLAAILATPGCEMRSYAHLRQRLRGGDVDAVACPGWIDRLDHVRVMGR